MSEHRLTCRETSIVLRTCKADMGSHSGFVWPRQGLVSCCDWKPTIECGNGLHGLLWGRGDYGLMSDRADAVWLLVEVETSSLVSLGQKVKFPYGRVVYAGNSRGAILKLKLEIAKVEAPKGSTTGDDAHSSTTGYAAHSSTTGDDAHSSTTGNHAHSSTTGDDAVSACLGYNGRAKASRGILLVSWLDQAAKRRRVAVGYPGENGIEEGVWYRADESGQLIKDESQDDHSIRQTNS